MSENFSVAPSAQNAKLRALTKAESSVSLNDGFAGFALERTMAQSEIDAVRALLSSKPRPVGWPERRKRIDEVGAVWPVADDVDLTAVDINGMPGEYSVVPGTDPSRVLMFFHGGGYCSGSTQSHRR